MYGLGKAAFKAIFSTSKALHLILLPKVYICGIICYAASINYSFAIAIEKH